MSMILFFTGVALCVFAIAHVGHWSASSLLQRRQQRARFEKTRQLIQKQINETRKPAEREIDAEGNWNGFRWFQVDRLVKETEVCTSVYLKPLDGKPIAKFRPGQHLTFKLEVPGINKPVIRCYSLSDAPGKDYYRISVKKVPPPRDKPDAPAGKASSFINEQLEVGDKIEVKAPSGHFYLDESSTLPVVLLGGGIGITPMVSMANYLMSQPSDRVVLLVYGAQNSSDQAFRRHLQDLSKQHDNFYAIYCYSKPGENDKLQRDYQVQGFVSADLLKKLIPDNRCQFYLCGPPPFMESIYNGLLDWGVPEEQVHFEAFGPATIGKTKQQDSRQNDRSANHEVTFSKSQLIANWSTDHESILELAEANDLFIDSGCRAGSCGTCATRILKGKVNYQNNQHVECGPDECLVCIAKPDGELELDV